MQTYEIPKTALVICDNQQVRMLLVKACRLGGYAVHPPSTSDDCGMSDGAGQADLILIDLPNDGKGELAWISRLRSVPETMTLPIIVTCPMLDHEATVAALDAGADDVAQRPGSFDELLARMRAVIRRRSPELVRDEVSYGALTVCPLDRKVVVRASGAGSGKVGPTEFLADTWTLSNSSPRQAVGADGCIAMNSRPTL